MDGLDGAAAQNTKNVLGWGVGSLYGVNPNVSMVSDTVGKTVFSHKSIYFLAKK